MKPSPREPQPDRTNGKPSLAPAKPPTLKRIRTRHHRLAQLLAVGVRPAEAELLTGFSRATIYRLQSQDPAFRELVEHYRRTEEAVFVDMGRMMADLGIEAVEALRDRLREDPDEFTPKELMELVRTLADRTGYGPARKEERTVAFKGLAEKMAEVIDGEAEEVSGGHEAD